MRQPPFRSLVLASSLILVVLWSCQDGGSTPDDPKNDTRLLVKQAYDSIDYSNLFVIFNERRADTLKAQLDREIDQSKRLTLGMSLGLELMRAGKTAEALSLFIGITQAIGKNKIPIEPQIRRYMYSVIGITYLRHGEVENCVQSHNHASCIIPIAGDGIHTRTTGSENAIRQYEYCLKEFPEDLETKYLLNLAYMTLGKYPDGVPSAYRIPPSWFQSKIKIQPFQDIASVIGVNRKGHAGGCVVDDFNNDGWLDIAASSWGPTDQLMLYINNRNGTFSDQTSAYGLEGHVASLNINQTDYNNDGWIDLYMMRGAWYQKEGDIPNTLLMNTGTGSFEDVTIRAGLTHHAATQASAWADFNLDGWVDLVVANESQDGYERGIDLYINQQNGRFRHESQKYGLTMNRFFKGCVATDVNNDRYPDIYFTSLGDGNYLFLNEDDGQGGRVFREPGPMTNVNAPVKSFPCWSFDYNNDGMEDLFVSSYNNDIPPVTFWMESKTGKADLAYLPKLYVNKGNLQFDEVGYSSGLTEVAFTMGCNFGDINTDGYLDFYLATGNPAYQSLVPNKMYLNMDGKRFEDVSYSGGFANVQKGHGVGFGDLDHDGDEDIYVVIGGAFDGDFFYNTLYENPNEKKGNWVVLDLEGTTANKKAIGARVMLTVTEGGKERKIYRTVTSGASFGGNSLILEVGLGKATTIKSVNIQWPCKDCPDQEYTGMEINKAYKLTQGTTAPGAIVYDAVRLGYGGSQEHQHTGH